MQMKSCVTIPTLLGKCRLVHEQLKYLILSGRKGGSKNRSNRTTCVGVIRVEECIVKFSCFLPSLVSVQGIMTCIKVIL